MLRDADDPVRTNNAIVLLTSTASNTEEGQVMTDAEKLLVLNDFFAWSDGTLLASDGQILVYMEDSYLFEGFDEDEVVEYLRSEIWREGSDFDGDGGEEVKDGE